MNPEQVYEIIRKALDEGVSLHTWTLLLVGAIALIGGYLGSYVRTKARNLATKEDIEEITNKVESIKAEYAKQLELLKQEHSQLMQLQELKHKLSVAALDKRLAAHQEAYALWWKLVGSAGKKEGEDVAFECQEWWVHNSLYLGANVRNAFSQAYHAAFVHRDLIDAHSDGKQIKKNWEAIRQLGEVIVNEVALPSWSEQEYTPIEKKATG
jgi:hypothetical protein